MKQTMFETMSQWLRVGLGSADQLKVQQDGSADAAFDAAKAAFKAADAALSAADAAYKAADAAYVAAYKAAYVVAVEVK
jgi:hypothetical protein